MKSIIEKKIINYLIIFLSKKLIFNLYDAHLKLIINHINCLFYNYKN